MAANDYSTHLVAASSQAFSAVDHADFKPTGNFTVGAWFKTSGNTQYIFQSYNETSKSAGWIIYIQVDGKLVFWSAKNSGTTANVDYAKITTTSAVNDGAWHWVVGVWNGSNLNVYIDGSSAATAVSWANAPVYQATNYVRVGCASSGSDGTFFNGNIDEVFLINGTAWDLTTVQSYYKKVITGATNLKAYYQFENGNTDSSGNSHTLTNIGSPTFQLDVPFTGITTNYLKNYRRESDVGGATGNNLSNYRRGSSRI